MAERASELQLRTTPQPPVLAGAATRRLLRSYENAVLGILGVAVFLGLWEWAGNNMESGKLFFSSPTAVAATFTRLSVQPSFWNDVWVSLQEFLVGYVGSIIIGIPLGISMGWYRRFNATLDPLVSAFQATPRVALVPLLLIWFGIGIWSKVALVFLGAVFPIIISTLAGIRSLDESLLKVSRSFGARDWQIFTTLAVPASVPFILAGLKLAVGRALIGVVVAEYVAAQAGIGQMMAKAGATFQTDRVMVGVLLIAFFGIASVEILRRIENRFDTWRPQRNAG